MKIKSVIKTLGVSALSFMLMSNVSAKTIEERKAEMIKQLDNYHFDFKHVNMEDSFKIVQYSKPYAEEEWVAQSIRERFYSFWLRSELENIIEFGTDNQIDIFCYKKGEEYEVYDENGMHKEIAEVDKCDISLYFTEEPDGDWDTNVLNYTITGKITEVEGNPEYKKEALEIVKSISKNSFVVDMDSLNHEINYKTTTSTFFDGNNALSEFNTLKKAVEENPKYDFSVGFEDVRRGDYFVGIEDGAIFIKRDGILYGYANNEYGAGGLFFVPIGTKREDATKIVKERIEKYLNNPNIKVEVKESKIQYDDNDIVEEVVNASNIVLNVLDMKIDEYYKTRNTNSEIEKNKLSNPTDYDNEGAIAVRVYNVIIDGVEHEVGIIEVDDETLNRVGLISSVDKETGIMINTKSENVPLDSKLDVNEFELTKEQEKLLKKLGFENIKSFNLKLYSKILDKYISQFNNESEIFIPLIDGIETDHLKMIYMADDLSKTETYDVDVVEIDGMKYLKFSTSHFSNYTLGLPEEVPPTYDSIMEYVAFLGISTAGLATILILRRKSNN